MSFLISLLIFFFVVFVVESCPVVVVICFIDAKEGKLWMHALVPRTIWELMKLERISRTKYYRWLTWISTKGEWAKKQKTKRILWFLGTCEFVSALRGSSQSFHVESERNSSIGCPCPCDGTINMGMTKKSFWPFSWSCQSENYHTNDDIKIIAILLDFFFFSCFAFDAFASTWNWFVDSGALLIYALANLCNWQKWLSGSK